MKRIKYASTILILFLFVTFCNIKNEKERTQLKVTSTAFSNYDFIPEKYTCDGKNVNPPLKVEQIPPQTKSLALIVDGPSSFYGYGTWVYWVVWNIPPVNEIKEGEVPGKEGINSFKEHSYNGPCSASNVHRYYFKVYALDEMLTLDTSSGKEELVAAMEDHVIAYGELMGLYRRQD